MRGRGSVARILLHREASQYHAEKSGFPWLELVYRLADKDSQATLFGKGELWTVR